MNRKKLLWSPVLFITLIIFLSLEQPYVASFDEQRVLVIFKEEINESLLEEVNAVVHHRFETIASVAISVEKTQLTKIIEHDDTLLVEEDYIVEIEFSQQTSHQWPIERTNIPSAWSNNYRGNGVKIAVIDTGIDTQHPDLTIEEGMCFNTTVLNGCKNSFEDDNGHGTHVAGIIAGYNPTKPFFGVVPEATLYVIKAMDSEGKGNTSDIIKGIEWALERNVDIINLSLSTDNDSTPLKLAVEKAYESGVLVVAAAGNKGSKTGSGDTVEYPAKYEAVIAVASVNDRNRRSEFSATGETVEIAAPGEFIYSLFPLMLDRDGNPDGYSLQSGTSMAAPYVTGILALYKQQNPHLSSYELRELLQKNAVDLGQIGWDPWYGHGLIQAEAGIVLSQPVVNVAQTELGSISLFWEAVEHAIFYEIYRDGALISEQTELEYVDWLIKGTYTYDVIAFSETGKKSSSASPIIVELTTVDFLDLKNDSWYTPHMIYLSNRSIVTGFPDHTLRPYETVTRAQAVTMLGRALGFENDKVKTVFEDVDKESFASGYIQQAFDRKIVTGFPDGSFRPDQPVTRAEMAILIARAYQFDDEAKSIFSDVTDQMQAFKAINSVAANKITIGYDDGTFRPEEHMNRLQYAVFIARAENEAFR